MSPAGHNGWHLSESELKPALAFALALEHAPMGLLMLRDDSDGGLLQPVVAEGLTSEQSQRFGAHMPGVGPIGVAYSEHRHVTIKDATSDAEEFHGALRDIANRVGFRGLDVVPLMLDNGAVLGALAALFPAPRHLSARSVRLVEGWGRLLALALDHARLSGEAERRREVAESISRARVQFVARVSHELRTPLQSITGYVDLLGLEGQESLTPRQTELLERVRKSEQILMNVIEDLVGLARLEAGKVSYAVGAVQVSDVLAMSEIVVAPLARHRGVTLEIPPLTTPLVVRADDGKLKQVLINLLTNAVKFTPRGGYVRLTCRANAAHVCFDVADSGPGIAAERLSDIFEP